jgi:hypothetical protein
MRSLRLVLAVVALLVGLVWIGQGIGLIGGSVMSAQPIWAVIGAALVVVAAGLGWSLRAGRDRPPVGR